MTRRPRSSHAALPVIAAALGLLAPSSAVAQPGPPAPAATGTGGQVGARVDAAAAAATAVPAVPAPSKKDTYLASKASERPGTRRRRAAAVPGKPAAPVISVFNTWTHEWLVLERDGKRLPPPALVDRFLRCHFTDQHTGMRKELIATLRDAGRHFSARRIDIVSGYRSPKYNLMLRKKGHEVAKDSQHTHGQAVDFRIPGVDVLDLERWARDRRTGGVGLYRDSKFIHVDVGPVRTWNGT